MNTYINTALIKSDAKKMLKGHYGPIIVIALISLCATAAVSYLQSLLLISFNLVDLESGTYAFDFTDITNIKLYIFGAIMLLSSLISFIVTSPLTLGICRYMFKFVSGKNAQLEDVFFYFASFKSFAKSLFFYIRKTLLQIFWGIICFAPGIIAYGMGIYLSGADIYAILNGESVTVSNESALTILSLGGLLLLGGVFLYLIITVKYFLADYIIASDDAVTPKMAISIAVRMMKGRAFQYIGFIISFIGWILLSILTCGVLLLFTVPYFMVSTALFARTVIDVNLNPPPPPPPPFSNMF